MSPVSPMSQMRERITTKVVVLAGLLVALLLAGVVSFYASNSPDGLNRVAQDNGFSSAAKKHHVADGPFAGYETKGIANGRLSGGLAGVAGSLVVLTLAGGVAFAVRRRRAAGDTVGDLQRDPQGDPQNVSG